MAKVEVQALNPVFLDEANVADFNITPPIGFARWRAVHNLHGKDLNILAPGEIGVIGMRLVESALRATKE